ncbi:MFS general substrate transporter [Lentinus tigrinus ALCF2SS1-7]|uniref:MFS general substrate transporter n=1 Tax=Lentinus tigrinus ALCF2SS1-7 TaxID=1328758 RepID=UPI001165E85A|nr:MFS general substrate transporter [Lentinus tigrinus ALCF2SS1-7]
MSTCDRARRAGSDIERRLPSMEKDEKDLSITHYEDAAEAPSVDYVINPDAERRLVRRIDIRMVTSSTCMYMLCFIDRFNIGNAKILNSDTGDSLQQSLRLSETQYLIALMVFFVAYTIFETPSNYLLKKYRPSRWFAFLMVTWGVMTMLIAATRNYAGLIVTRFLLGTFEAGLFPGIVYCLTFWYKPNERAIRIALVLAGATLGGAFGSAIAYGVGKINGAHGLEAWRWLFIIEGIPACALAPLILLYYPDYPETVSWLSPEERELAVERIKGVASLGHAKITWVEARETLFDWRLYLHHYIWIAYSVGFSSISLFTPTVVQGLGFQGLSAQLFTVPPYAIAFCVVTTNAWIADRYEIRSWCSVCSFALCGVSFVIEGSLPATAFAARYAVLCFAVSFAFAISGPTLSWLTANLRGTGASTLAVPLNGSFATFGQIVGIFIYKSSESPGFPTGHYTNAGFMFSGAIAGLVLRCVYARRNRKLASGEPRWRM